MSRHDEAVLPRKDLFELPEGVIYLDGNSLGPLVKAARSHLLDVVDKEWGQRLIRGWNDAGWMEQPERVGNLIARLIGASSGSVVMGDTLSIKVYQALASALEMRPDRRIILSDSGNFPTDLYMAEGLIETLQRGHELKIVAPEEIEGAIDDQVAALMLTEVDYRSGRKHDMHAITKCAHDKGAVMIWDLAHSAGAIPVDLETAGCEFAVGCTYKYLNGGPGSPAFIYVRPDIIDSVRPALAGWMGHASPFTFEQGYRPANTVERLRVGTPPVLQMSALEAALCIWDGISLETVRTASIRLSERFIKEVESRCSLLKLASPRDPHHRGSQVSFAFEHGYALMQALIDRGVIGDFRSPDIMRFGFTPFYLSEADVVAAVDVLEDIFADGLWTDYIGRKTNRVT